MWRAGVCGWACTACTWRRRAWANMGGLVHGVGGHGRTWAGIGVLEVTYKKRGPAKDRT